MLGKLYLVVLPVTIAAVLQGCVRARVPAPLTVEEAAAAQSPLTGRQAPDFGLPDADGQHVALSSLRGKWVVLYFYPKDDTPGCLCQANEFTHLLRNFRALNAEVLGVSPDSPQAHKAFARKYRLALRLLSDPAHEAMSRYGAWVRVDTALVPHSRVIRSTVIIDPDGAIAYHWPEVIPQGHAERVRRKLLELQNKRAAPTEAGKPAS